MTTSSHDIGANYSSANFQRVPYQDLFHTNEGSFSVPKNLSIRRCTSWQNWSTPWPHDSDTNLKLQKCKTWVLLKKKYALLYLWTQPSSIPHFLNIQVLEGYIYIYIWNCFSFFLFLCTGNYPNKGWINLKLTLPLGCLHGEVKPISHWDPPIDGLLQAQHLPTRIILFLFFCIRLTAVSRMSRYCIRVWPRRFLCWPTPKSRALLVYLVMINPKLWIDLELR